MIPRRGEAAPRDAVTMRAFTAAIGSSVVRVLLAVAGMLAVIVLRSHPAGASDQAGPPPAERSRRISELSDQLHQKDPWPAIRQQRIVQLLPKAMDAAGVDAWIVFCRENHNDPLARHVGGENA